MALRSSEVDKEPRVSPNTRCRLLELPVELRLLIYDFALPHLGVAFELPRDNVLLQKNSPITITVSCTCDLVCILPSDRRAALLRTCKTINKEALAIVYEKTCFDIRLWPHTSTQTLECGKPNRYSVYPSKALRGTFDLVHDMEIHFVAARRSWPAEQLSAQAQQAGYLVRLANESRAMRTLTIIIFARDQIDATAWDETMEAFGRLKPNVQVNVVKSLCCPAEEWRMVEASYTKMLEASSG